MQRHPREAIVATAQADLSVTMANMVERHQLTISEVVRILNEVQGRWINYQIRDERQLNDTDKPADSAP